MSEMIVGSIRTNANPASGIYEALLEKAERERDYYKDALEEISTTIQEYKDSMVQEPSEDFILAIKAWTDKKLKEV